MATCPDCNNELPDGVEVGDCIVCAAYAEASADAESDEWREWGTSPLLFPTTVRVASADEGRGRDVPALTSPAAPGLAVTMATFGEFNVTHVPSGYCMTKANFERASNALLILAKFAAIGAADNVDFESDRLAVAAEFKRCAENQCPFEGAMSTGHDGTRPQTVSEWLRILASTEATDEFPWETADENPGNRAIVLLRPVASDG